MDYVAVSATAKHHILYYAPAKRNSVLKPVESQYNLLILFTDIKQLAVHKRSFNLMKLREVLSNIIYSE